MCADSVFGGEKQRLYLETGVMRKLVYKPQNNKNQRKWFLQNFISSRDGPEKLQKQGRDESMQEDFPTSVAYTANIGSLLACFHLCLVSVAFQVHPYLKWTFAETISFGFCCFGVCKPTST